MNTFVNTDLKTSFLPSFTRFKKYCDQADSIYDNTRDIRYLISVLSNLELVNPRLSGMINTRKTALSSYDWKIEDKGSDNADLKLKLTDSIAFIIENFINCELYGALLFKIDWALNDRFEPNAIELIDKLNVEKMQDGSLAIIDYGKGKTATIIDEKDPNYLGVSFGELRGGLLRKIAPQSIMLNEMVNKWKDLNKKLQGVVIGSIDGESLQREASALNLNQEQISDLSVDLESALASAGENNYLKTIKSVEIKLAQLADAAAGTSYMNIINELNNNIAIAILGQANTSQLPNSGGSRAALQILNLVRSDIHFSDMLKLEKLINKFLAKYYYKNNLQYNSSPYKFKWVYEDVKDREQYARIYEYMSRMQTPAVKSEFYANLGLTEPTPTDEVIDFKTSNTSFNI